MEYLARPMARKTIGNIYLPAMRRSICQPVAHKSNLDITSCTIVIEPAESR
ncbi:hypothetical protein NKI66_30825 [Mesorhizobium sp. M0518]|uniref:hypothetical protein n=1 Tax=Mesorhizobium sp. M0518 TaxID=2956956 RepID=UPI00333B1D79